MREDETIKELDGLSCMCEITGSLTISHTSAGEGVAPPHASTDLELEAIERIGGDLAILEVPGLTTLRGMRGLAEVGGDIRVKDNRSLLGIRFGVLERLGGVMSITGNTELSYLLLPALETAGGITLGDGVTWHDDFAVLDLS